MTSIPQSPSYPFPRPSPRLPQQPCSPSPVVPRVATPALPPLSLPLPAPRLSRHPSTRSNDSDAREELRTPTTPTPPSAPIPDRQPQFYIASSSSPQKPVQPVVNQRPPTPTPSHPARIRDLADVIQRVYTGYTRQDRLLQSPLILDALIHFRERAEDLLDALEAEKRGRRGRGQQVKQSEVELARADERFGRDVQELEEEWWSSAVVANWFGPQPHTVKRQKSRRRRKGRRAAPKIMDQTNGAGSAEGGVVNQKVDASLLGEVLDVDEAIGVLGDRQVELWRISSFATWEWGGVHE